MNEGESDKQSILWSFQKIFKVAIIVIFIDSCLSSLCELKYIIPYYIPPIHLLQ